MTTTVNNIDDLLRIIDDNPQYAEALRTRLLTRELLELPQTVADMAQVVADMGVRLSDLERVVADLAQRLGQLEQVVADLAQRLTQLEQVVADLAQRLGQLEQVVADLAQRLGQLEQVVADLAQRLTQLEQTVADLAQVVAELIVEFREFVRVTNERLAALEHGQQELLEGQQILRVDLDRTVARLDRLQDDVGWIKGRIIYDIVQKDAGMIAREMGFELVDTLARADLMDMTRANDTSDLARGDLLSFHRADLVMRAADYDGRIHYIAVEASFTVNGRDSRRALRNAEYIARFTGLPALSAVAGVRSDYDIPPLVETGRLHWYEIPSEDVESE